LASFVMFLSLVLNAMCKEMKETCAGDACTKETFPLKKKKALLQLTKQGFDATNVDEEEGNEHGKPTLLEARLPLRQGDSGKQAAQGQSKQVTPHSLVVDFFNAPSMVPTESNWGTAMRNLMGFCVKKGYKAGVPTGYVGTVGGKAVRGVFCFNGTGVKYVNLPTSRHRWNKVETYWGDAQANMDEKCYRYGKSEYKTGIPNGYLSSGHRAGYCFKKGPFIKHYQFRIAGLGFKIYDQHSWGHEMRTIGGFCQQNKWDWGFPTGRALGKRSRSYAEAYCFKEG